MDLSPSQRRLSLAAVMFHMVGIGLTLGITFPLTSLTLETWGSAAWVIGLAGAMAPIAVLVFMPFLPKIVSRLGAVRAMVLGCSVGIAALAVMYFVQTIPVWMVARFVMGAGMALPWLAGDVWINSIAPEERRGRIVAAYAACFFIGFSLGPLALDIVGIGGVPPFVLAGLALALAAFPLIPLARFAPLIEVEGTGNVITAAMAVPVVAVGAFLAGFSEATVFSLLPVWGLEIGLGEDSALRLLTICIAGGVLMQLVIGPTADRIGRQRFLGLIGLALVVSSAVLHLTAGLVLIAAAFVVGGLVLGLYGMSLTLLGERLPPEKLAVASAAFLILYQLGAMTGPVIAGGAMDQFGTIGFLASLALCGAVMAVVALPGEKRARLERARSE